MRQVIPANRRFRVLIGTFFDEDDNLDDAYMFADYTVVGFISEQDSENYDNISFDPVWVEDNPDGRVMSVQDIEFSNNERVLLIYDQDDESSEKTIGRAKRAFLSDVNERIKRRIEKEKEKAEAK